MGESVFRLQPNFSEKLKTNMSLYKNKKSSPIFFTNSVKKNVGIINSGFRKQNSFWRNLSYFSVPLSWKRSNLVSLGTDVGISL